MGLLDKRPRALTLALTAVGALVAAVLLVGAFLVATGGSDDGGSAKESLNTDFKEPQKFDLDEVYDDSGFSCEARDTMCVRKFLVGVTADYGPRASLPSSERLAARAARRPLGQRPRPRPHGRPRTAKRFGSNLEAFDLCPNTFNYGCPHGYFEKVLGRRPARPRPRRRDLRDARRLEPVATARFSCYHGVGHGVMMAEAYDLEARSPPATRSPTHRARRGAGRASSWRTSTGPCAGEARKGVFSRRDPLAPCDGVGEAYRHQCFINHAGWLMTSRGTTSRPPPRYCLDAPGDYVGCACRASG